MTAGLVAGFGSQVALADPGTTSPATPTAAAASDSGMPQFKSADELLAYIDQEYDMGAGGGQLSNLIKSVMKLRAAGFKPSKANVAAIIQALNYRPNQKPLIDALSDTLAYQQKIKAQSDLLQQARAAQNNNSAVMGAGQMPGDSNPGFGGGQQSAPPAAPITP
ncbi:hypothetical protein [Candidatus Mycolicibacterium alkanivorans]|uniref:Uncharacterized protein n=1 Tax=Candidatus Mycolicibacterium alkanivorans TaxID=2954114 RepID=A0ABS9YWG4_9MYCO|nr:hypothetical protein [Candidatus Mycolicibacterium alkanivorans]MCI4675568.1 hypothetical protein [Candidatus Mycolicibacterium alkanivorans]